MDLLSRRRGGALVQSRFPYNICIFGPTRFTWPTISCPGNGRKRNVGRKQGRRAPAPWLTATPTTQVSNLGKSSGLNGCCWAGVASREPRSRSWLICWGLLPHGLYCNSSEFCEKVGKALPAHGREGLAATDSHSQNPLYSIQETSTPRGSFSGSRVVQLPEWFFRPLLGKACWIVFQLANMSV